MDTSAPPPVDPARAAENNTSRILAVSAVVHFTALTILALRLYTRAFVVRAFGSHDIAMTLAAVSSLLLAHPDYILDTIARHLDGKTGATQAKDTVLEVTNQGASFAL